jgi:hypothetical protein
MIIATRRLMDIGIDLLASYSIGGKQTSIQACTRFLKRPRNRFATRKKLPSNKPPTPI